MTATETKNFLNRALDHLAAEHSFDPAVELRLAAAACRFAQGTPLGELARDRHTGMLIASVAAAATQTNEEN